MAHRKTGGSTQLGRDSQSKRLGVKIFAGQLAKKGAIIVKQRGSKFYPGLNAKQSGDDTIFALAEGLVSFRRKRAQAYDGKIVFRKMIDVKPAEVKK